MTKKKEIDLASLFPLRKLAGVAILHLPDEDRWIACYRRQLDASSYKDYHLSAPSQTALMSLISTMRGRHWK